MAYQLVRGEVTGISQVTKCPFCLGKIDSSFVPGRDSIILKHSPSAESEAHVEIILEHECGHAPTIEFKIVEPLSL